MGKYSENHVSLEDHEFYLCSEYSWKILEILK